MGLAFIGWWRSLPRHAHPEARQPHLPCTPCTQPLELVARVLCPPCCASGGADPGPVSPMSCTSGRANPVVLWESLGLAPMSS